MSVPIPFWRILFGGIVVLAFPFAINGQDEPAAARPAARVLDQLIETGEQAIGALPLGNKTKAATSNLLPKQPASDKSEPEQPAAEEKNKTRYWTTTWSFRDVDVQRFLSRLQSVGIEIPIHAAGQVTVELDVSIPLNRLREGRAYRFKGRFRSPDLQLDNLRLTDLEAELNYDDGVLELSKLGSGWSDGTAAAESESLAPADHKTSAGRMSGSARMQLLPRGEFEARLELHRLPLGSLQSLLLDINKVETARGKTTAPPNRAPNRVEGELSGQVTASVPVVDLSKLPAWKIDGELQLANVAASQSTPFNLQTGVVKLRRGVLLAEKVSVASMQDRSAQLDLACELELVGQQRFQFQMRADDFPLETVSGLAGKDHVVTGKLDLDLRGRGDIKTWQWNLQGRIASPDCHLFGQEIGVLEHQLRFSRDRFELLPEHLPNLLPAGMLIRSVRTSYRLLPNAFELDELDAELFGGRINGRMTIARRKSKRHSLELNWSNLAPTLIHRAMGPTPPLLRFQSSGGIVWSLPFDGWSRPIQHEGQVRIRFEPIEVNRGQVGFAELNAAVKDGIFKLVGDGQVLGGKFSVDLVTRALAEETWRWFLHRSPEGHARLDQVQLDRLVRTFAPRYRRRVRGTLAASLRYHVDEEEGSTVPACRLTARDVAMDGRMLTRQLEAFAMVRGERFVVERVRGSLAGGQLMADGKWTLGAGPRQMQVRISGADVSDLLFPIAQSMSPNLAGVSSGSATVTYNQGIRFRAALTSRDSELFGIPMGTLHSGLSGSLSADLRRWKVLFPSIQGDVAKGQVAGEMALSSSQSRTKSFDMSSRWNARRVDFGHLLTASAISTRIAHGSVSGELTLGGRGIRGIHDLKGRFDARLGTTQAAAIPGLIQADQFLGLITLSGTQFKQGRVEGVIGSGDALINEFELSSDRIRVWSQGKIRLDNLRMDMEVVISTGDFRLANQELLAFAGQLAMQSVFPVTTLVELNRLLRDRTIYLDVTGSMRDPRLRLKPLDIIREEALRFLIRELLVAASIRKD